MKYSFSYLIRLEFLGFRFSGWQKQANAKTLHDIVDKSLSFVFEDSAYKTIGIGRTDAKVSADDFAFELFLNEAIDIPKMLKDLNHNLPFDIRVKTIEEVDVKFNIIQNPKIKEYHYYFSFGDKSHPFNAPHIINFEQTLDIAKMQEAVKVYEGTHNFKRFACKPSAQTIFVREILSATIEKNTRYLGEHVPENAHVFKIRSKGFLRYQVRLMMAALIDVGSGVYAIEDLKSILTDYDKEPMKHNAPSSGLNLHKINF